MPTVLQEGIRCQGEVSAWRGLVLGALVPGRAEEAKGAIVGPEAREQEDRGAPLHMVPVTGARNSSATRRAWSERSERCDNLMKFGTSSSGCEPRPARGEPAQPVASLATARGDAAGDA